MDIEILLLAEGGDFPLPVNKHGKCRRLDAPNHHLLFVERRKQPGAVDSDNPIGF